MTKRRVTRYLVFGRNGEGKVPPVEERLPLALARFLYVAGDCSPVEIVVHSTEREAAAETLKALTTADLRLALAQLSNDSPHPTDYQVTALVASLSDLLVRSSGGCLVPEVWLGVAENEEEMMKAVPSEQPSSLDRMTEMPSQRPPGYVELDGIPFDLRWENGGVVLERIYEECE